MGQDAGSQPGSGSKFLSSRGLSLFLLFFVFCGNILSRYLLIFVYSAPVDGMTPSEKKKHSLSEAIPMSSTAYGVLVGPAFMAVFSVGGLCAGWAADHLNRKRVIAVAALVWSLAITALGFCTEYWHVLLSRFVLGASEAFCPALAYSLIADLFPPQARATGESGGACARVLACEGSIM